MTPLDLQVIRSIALSLTVIIMSLIGGCEVQTWVEAKYKKPEPVLTDPVAQRLYAVSPYIGYIENSRRVDVVKMLCEGKTLPYDVVDSLPADVRKAAITASSTNSTPK